MVHIRENKTEMEKTQNKVLKWGNTLYLYSPKSVKRHKERLKRLLYINEKRKAFKKALIEENLLLYLKEKMSKITSVPKMENKINVSVP